MCDKAFSGARLFLVEHRSYRNGDSVVMCPAMQFREKSARVAARRLADHPRHGCLHHDGYYVIYESGKRLAEYQGRDL